MAYGDEAPASPPRTWRDDAAAEPQPWHRYGDGLSAHSLYAAPTAPPDIDPDRDHGRAGASDWAPAPAPDPAGASDPAPDADPVPDLDRASGSPGWASRETAPRPESESPAATPEGPIRAPIGEPLVEPGGTGGRHASRRASGRAGRNLPAAIGVGLGLGAILVASLIFWRPAFVAVLMIAVAIGTWEMVRAVNERAQPPLLPLLAGGPVMIGLGWYGGAETLPLGVLAALIAVLVWRLGDRPTGHQRDLTAAVLVIMYVPFLATFAALLARPIDGDLRVIAVVAGVVLSDTGGYVFGVRFGRRLMAPSVSPKKSWEGFAGSMVSAGVGGAILLHLMLGAEYWEGAVFGLAVSAAAVVGDLAESVLKRDLGIKDMSNLLPGHGGLMDRLDSILFALPVGYAALAVVAPAAL
ncbi:MAG TPA: phosphatidate cytidylyltransferase [Micromonosporaceae bacterium]|nr:phosphatidate cytidylyltransferase [Micromonosporaceae bacterium]